MVFIDFTGKVDLGRHYSIIILPVYNPNLNHWCVVRQTFELPASGGVVPNNFYTITKLIRYTTTEDYVVMGAELVLLFFCVFYTIEEIIEISSLKKQYFKGFFNNADWIVILMCFLILGHRLVLNSQQFIAQS